MTSTEAASAVRRRHEAMQRTLELVLRPARGIVTHAGRGYADELLLDVEDDATGVWKLGTQGSEWHVYDGDRVVFTRSRPDLGDLHLESLVGARLEDVQCLEDLGLIARLADGRSVRIGGQACQDGDWPPDLPYWELFTPHDDVVSAGPGLAWSVQAADEPDQRPSGPTSSALKLLRLRDLLRLWAWTMREMRDRGVVRTANNPIGDIAEELVARHFHGRRGSFVQAGWDVETDSGERLQVKALRRTPDGRRRNLSPIRSRDYDAVVVVVFDEDLRVRDGWRIPRSVVERRFAHSDHVNGVIVRVSEALLADPDVVPVALSDAHLDA